MKRIILAAMSTILVFALCACSGSNDSPAPDSTTPISSVQPAEEPPPAESEPKEPPPAELEPEEDGLGDLFDNYPVPDGYDDEIRQEVFYFELVSLEGDPGDGLTPRDGAALADELLTTIGLYSDNGGVPAGRCVFISFDELAVLDSAMGRECYIYSVGLGTAEGGLMGDDYQVIYRVSVDYSGDKTAAVYEDYSGEYDGEGRGDLITDEPGEGRGDIIDDGE